MVETSKLKTRSLCLPLCVWFESFKVIGFKSLGSAQIFVFQSISWDGGFLGYLVFM